MKIYFVLGIIFLFSLQNSISRILLHPYLMGADSRTHSMWVLVETNSKENVIVGYETNCAMRFDSTKFFVETDKFIKSYVHRILLDSLIPGKKYSYWIEDKPFGRAYISSFYAPSEINESCKFAIMSDPHKNPEIHNQIAGKIAEHEPMFCVYAGDLAGNPTHSTWNNEFFVENELNLISKSPFANSIGNHDVWRNSTPAYLQSPFNVKSSESNKPYYDFDYSDIHFVVISLENNLEKGSEQYKFIEKSLSESKKKFKLVISHHPVYSSGGQGDNGTLIKLSKELFKPNNVQAVISGHCHFYQHNIVDGIHYFIIGGGGGDLHEPTSKGCTLNTLKVHHFGIVNYLNGKLEFSFFDINGKLFDKIVLN